MPNPRPLDGRSRNTRLAKELPPEVIIAQSKWQCPDCLATFSRKDSLQEHLRNSKTKRPCTQRKRPLGFIPTQGGMGLPTALPQGSQSGAGSSISSVAGATGSEPGYSATTSLNDRFATNAAPTVTPLPMELVAAISRADGRIRGPTPSVLGGTSISAMAGASMNALGGASLSAFGGNSMSAQSQRQIMPMDMLFMAFASDPESASMVSTPSVTDEVTEMIQGGSPSLAEQLDYHSFAGDEHAPLPGPSELAALYPEVPGQFFSPEPVMSYLLQQFEEYDHVKVPVLHMPTFRRDLAAGYADPAVLTAVLWSAMRMSNPNDLVELASNLPPDSYDPLFLDMEMHRLETSGYCFRRVLDDWEALQVELEEHAENEDPLLLDRLANLTRAALLLIESCMAVGLQTIANRFHRIILEAVPYLKFGQLSLDLVPKDLDDSEILAAELRSRLFVAIFNARAMIMDALDLPLHEAWSDVKYDRAVGAYTPQWANLWVPLPDDLFDRLPPMPLTAEEKSEWREAFGNNDNGASDSVHSIFASLTRRRIGDLFVWMQLPFGHPHRARMTKEFGSQFFVAGYRGVQLLFYGIAEKFLHVKQFFVSKGWLLYAPPPESEGETAVVQLRGILNQIWLDLPTEVRTFVDECDGRAVRELSARHWGRTRRGCLPYFVVGLNTFELILDSPSDIFDHIVRDEGWPFDEAFVRAQAAAITVSRIIKSSLEVDPGPHSGLDQQDEVKRVPAVWSRFVLRACWVHVVSIRKFRLLLQNQGPDSSLITAAIQTVSRLVDDVQSTLAGLVEVGSAFRNLLAAYSVVKSLVEQDIVSMLDPDTHGTVAEEHVWAGPTMEEMDLLKGRLEPEDEEYKRAIESFLEEGGEKPDYRVWLSRWKGRRVESEA